MLQLENKFNVADNINIKKITKFRVRVLRIKGLKYKRKYM